MRAVEEFTQDNFWLALFVIISGLKLFYAPLASEDLFIWVASGLKMIDLGNFIYQDYFTIHQNLIFHYPSQLSNLMYGIIFKTGGSALLFFSLRGFGIFLLYFIAKNYLLKIEKNIWNLILSILLVFVMFYMLDRPQYLAYLPCLLFFKYVEDVKNTDNKSNFVFLVLVTFWVNIHPSVLILIPIYLAKISMQIVLKSWENFRQSIIQLALILIGVCLSPINFEIFNYLFKTYSKSSSRFAGEWRSLFFFHDSFLIVVVVFLMLYLLIKLVMQKKIKDYLLTGFYILPIMTLFSIRYAVFFSLLNFIVFLKMDLWLSGKYILRIKSPKAFTFILIFIATLLLDSNWKQNRFFDENYDKGLISFLSTKNNLRIYHEIDGGFLSTLLYQNNHKYFIDARNIIFNDEVFSDYASLKTNHRIFKLIEKYHFNAFIIKKANTEMINKLLSIGWVKIFEGDKTILFFKRA